MYDYKTSLNRYPKSTKRSLPEGCSPSSAWRERRMDFAPEKPALEVDEVRPSRPGGVGTGGEGAIEKADGEVLLPIAVSEKEEPAPGHAIVDEELRPPIERMRCRLEGGGWIGVLKTITELAWRNAELN
jgi:hypothetical protein